MCTLLCLLFIFGFLFCWVFCYFFSTKCNSGALQFRTCTQVEQSVIQRRLELSRERGKVFTDEYLEFIQWLDGIGAKTIAPAQYDGTLGYYLYYSTENAAWDAGDVENRSKSINKLKAILQSTTKPGDLLVIEFQCQGTLRNISVRLRIPRDDVYKFVIASAIAKSRFRSLEMVRDLTEEPALDVRLIASLMLMVDPTIDEALIKKLLNL